MRKKGMRQRGEAKLLHQRAREDETCFSLTIHCKFARPKQRRRGRRSGVAAARAAIEQEEREEKKKRNHMIDT